MTDQSSNMQLVRRAFETSAITGAGMFDIPSENARWTIAGSSPCGQTFNGRAAFLKSAFDPITSRFAGPMVPTIRDVIANGDTVVVRWDGVAPAKHGQTYRNSYAWFFTMRGGKVVEATAFLDLPTYDAALTAAALPHRPNAAQPNEMPGA